MIDNRHYPRDSHAMAFARATTKTSWKWHVHVRRRALARLSVSQDARWKMTPVP